MATTTNYGWTKPDVGGSGGAWGSILNTLIDAVDTALKAVSNVANAALAKAGGVMTGRLDVKTSTIARQDVVATSGAIAVDLSVAQYVTLTITGAAALTFTNVPANPLVAGVILRLTNGGAGVITWPTGTKWPSAVPPVLTASGVDLVVLTTDDGGTTWRGVLAAKDVR